MYKTSARSAVLVTLGFTLLGCHAAAPSTSTGASAGHPVAAQAQTQPHKPADTSAPDPRIVTLANPCEVIAGLTLAAEFGGDFTLVGGNQYPSVSGSFHERSCRYTGLVPGISYNPDGSGAPLAVTVTTYVDDASDTKWASLVQDAKSSGKYRVAVNSVDGPVGGDAFLTTQGAMSAHQRQIIIMFVATSDKYNVLTDEAAADVMLHTLGRLAPYNY